MRALVCAAPLQLGLQERPLPVPADGEALVRIRRVGVCGTDLHAFRGRQPFVDYPRVLGHELAGEVVELAAADSGLSVGDPVVVLPYLECGHCNACRAGRPNCCAALEVLGVHRDGGMQEFLALPTSHLLPAAGLDPAAAALVECLAIGAHATRRAAVTATDRVLVIGAGPIGQGVARFAAATGARVVVLERDPARRAVVADLVPGATILAPPVDGTPDDVIDRPADVVFDVTGSGASMARAIDALAHGGRMVFVGLVEGEFRIHHPAFHKREATLLASRNATRADFQTVLDALRSGACDATCMISQQVELAAAVDGFAAWSQPGSGVNKTVLHLS